MYSALKAAQSDVHTALLKFSDSLLEQKENPSVANSIQLLHAKQDSQFRVLSEALDTLNQNMSKIVTILMDRNSNTVTTATVIPSIQPVSTGEDLKNVCVTTHTSREASSSTVKEVKVDLEELEEEEARMK